MSDAIESVNELKALIRHDGKLASFVRNLYNRICDRLGLTAEKEKALRMWREA